MHSTDRDVYIGVKGLKTVRFGRDILLGNNNRITTMYHEDTK